MIFSFKVQWGLLNSLGLKPREFGIDLNSALAKIYCSAKAKNIFHFNTGLKPGAIHYKTQQGKIESSI